MRTLPVAEYLRFLERAGLAAADAPEPEQNSRVLDAYLALYRGEVGPIGDSPVVVLGERYGFALDPLDDERPGMNFALATPSVDFRLPATRAAFLQDLPRLREELAAGGGVVLTDTFRFADGYLDGPHDGIIGIHSPVARFDSGFAAYLASLTLDRRQKHKRLARDFADPRFRFELSPRLLSRGELDFASENLLRRWGAEGRAYALIQTLWTQAVASVLPDRALYMRVYDADRLVFVQTLLLRGGGAYTQSIFKSEDHFYNGIAPYTDFKTVELLCERGPGFLDPSCRASLDDPESIGVAKRVTVNRDVVKPILALGEGLPAEAQRLLATREIAGRPA